MATTVQFTRIENAAAETYLVQVNGWSTYSAGIISYEQNSNVWHYTGTVFEGQQPIIAWFDSRDEAMAAVKDNHVNGIEIAV